MFKKILIANRGEIACRIIRTCRRMGIQTVAVYSEVDQTALHVGQADEAIFLGASPASESYLRIDKIIHAARKTGAQAIHPGYGFLSENADFADALETEGISLIGPSASVIRLMGDKVQARQAAIRCAIPVVPGTEEPLKDASQALSISKKIGYPLMIKAVAGGGGKGMRLVHDASEFTAAFEAAQREAQSSFRDSRIFLERFIERPRHIEIQVLGDQHGQIIHLGERECSLQRRHQKVIEESPSSFLDQKTREKMTSQAIQLTQAVGYTSVGTVEFLVDQNKNFYFLEMNTRLQVEHTVTEQVTGLDLVEEMIRVARGEPLRYKQEEINFKGHAVEARICAEDPTLDFIPSPGKLIKYKEPLEARVDSGVEEGDEVSSFYDPLLSKVITHGKTREEAFSRLTQSLNQYVIEGTGQNLSFLMALTQHTEVLKGNLYTHFIQDVFPNGYRPERPAASSIEALFKWCAVLVQGVSSVVIVKVPHAIEEVILSDCPYNLEEIRESRICLKEKLTDKKHWLQISRLTWGVEVSGYGCKAFYEIYLSHLKPYLKYLPELEQGIKEPYVLTPMPGKIVRLMARVGDSLKQDQPIAIVEAMKMENILRSPQAGHVKEIYVQEGQTLESRQKILEFG